MKEIIMKNKKPLEYYQSLYYAIIIKEYSFENEKWYGAYCKELGEGSCYSSENTPIKTLKAFLKEKNDFIELLYKQNTPIPEPTKEK